MDYVASDVLGSSKSKCLPGFSCLQILPEVIGKSTDLRKAKTETEIGGFKARLPLSVCAPSSFLASTDAAKELAAGTALAGIPFIVGENSLVLFGAKGIKEKTKPFLDNSKKFGALVLQANALDLQSKGFEKSVSDCGATAIELVFGTGATMGIGTEFCLSDAKEATRLEKAGYILRKDNGSFHCSSMQAGVSEEELLEQLQACSELELPLWIRISIGAGITKFIHILQKIKREQDLPIKCLTVEGCHGNPQRIPLFEECGLPSAALFSVLEDKPSFDIVLSGNFSGSADAAKALMLGAKGIELSDCFIAAAKAPKEGKKNKIECLAKSLEQELQMVCAMQRIETIEELQRKKKNLFALSKEAADIFGISSNPKTAL